MIADQISKCVYSCNCMEALFIHILVSQGRTSRFVDELGSYRALSRNPALILRHRPQVPQVARH